MPWIKQIKKGLGVTLVITMLCPFSSFVSAKKIETEKATALVSPKGENKPGVSIDLSDKVNINQASIDELAQKLNGIGVQKAKAIVEYREKYGAFNSIENILEVQGIGPAFLEKNKDKLVL